MAELEQAWGPNIELVFAQAPYGDGLWMRDPPNGKEVATTDPNWAADSVQVLNDIVRTQGPFYGILGYSQGSAFVPYYLSVAAAGTFEVAMLFCGYLPTTHAGLLASLNSASPWSDIRALVFMGARDAVITNGMTQEQAAKFTSPVVITSRAAGHHVPQRSDPTFDQVVAFATSR
jgi:hypothetical protein